MKIELIEAIETEKSVLRQLLEYYAYDFSEYDLADVNEHGYFGYPYFDFYWTEVDRHPFFTKVGGKYAGFVLVYDYCYVLRDTGVKSVAEFFVMRKYRRKEVGKSIAFQVFDKFRGKFEVIQRGENIPAMLFWERVVNKYTGGRYKIEYASTESWEGQELIFDN